MHLLSASPEEAVSLCLSKNFINSASRSHEGTCAQSFWQDLAHSIHRLGFYHHHRHHHRRHHHQHQHCFYIKDLATFLLIATTSVSSADTVSAMRQALLWEFEHNKVRREHLSLLPPISRISWIISAWIRFSFQTTDQD